MGLTFETISPIEVLILVSGVPSYCRTDVSYEGLYTFNEASGVHRHRCSSKMTSVDTST
jgi:hypothetical protein